MNDNLDFISTTNTYLGEKNSDADINSYSKKMVTNKTTRSENFRITAYNPDEDISVIIESTGKYKKLKEFIDEIEKNFVIWEAQNDNYFLEGNIQISPKNNEEITLIACAPGKPDRVNISINDKTYDGIKVGDKYYIPLLYAKNTITEY